MADKKTLKELNETINTESNARKIIAQLFDEESFVEIGLDASSVITGYGTIDGAAVYTYVQDITVLSGALNKKSALKIKKLYDMAVKNGSPVVAFYDSKGGDIRESAELLTAYGDIVTNVTNLSGVVPQISVVTGLCAGITATVCCMADFVIMTEKAEFFLSAPFVNKDGSLKGAGSAQNAAKSGVANIVVKDTASAVETAKNLIKILPQNNLELSGNDYFEENNTVITADLKGADMVNAVADLKSVIEINADYGTAAYTGIGSINWRTVGFVATNKTSDKLTAADCSKIARFVNIMDAFSIPVVTIIDTDGFEQSSTDELSGSIRDTAKLAQIYSCTSTPKISLVTGNAIGAAFIALGSLNAGSDMLIAYENAVISPVLPKTAAVFLKADEIGDKSIDELANEYIATEASALCVLAKGFVDRVIEPSETRKALLSAIDINSSKRARNSGRKHINLVF